ncbi:MAG: hypothetical protein OXP73_00730, partial [Chloroflexota bacterium]|nr:hypothetical protein [Chloroflexota bacterium]
FSPAPFFFLHTITFVWGGWLPPAAAGPPIRWDLNRNGVTTDAGYAAAFPGPLPGLGCRTGRSG